MSMAGESAFASSALSMRLGTPIAFCRATDSS